jgi:hypothetical protein
MKMMQRDPAALHEALGASANNLEGMVDDLPKYRNKI